MKYIAFSMSSAGDTMNCTAGAAIVLFVLVLASSSPYIVYAHISIYGGWQGVKPAACPFLPIDHVSGSASPRPEAVTNLNRF